MMTARQTERPWNYTAYWNKGGIIVFVQVINYPAETARLYSVNGGLASLPLLTAAVAAAAADNCMSTAWQDAVGGVPERSSLIRLC